jgi:hypothetical protein
MPNWCNNVVEITHEDPAMIERVRKAFKDGGLLNEFIPCPAELHEHDAPNRDEALAKRFMEQYGATDWYNWQCKNWGTKWDIGGGDYNDPQDIPNGLTLCFDSAWAPPTDAYQTLMDDFGFSIKAFYYEPGMAFVGKWEDGDDDYCEYGGYSSDTVRDQIGAELDDMFNISEEIAQYEEEESQEND